MPKPWSAKHVPSHNHYRKLPTRLFHVHSCRAFAGNQLSQGHALPSLTWRIPKSLLVVVVPCNIRQFMTAAGRGHWECSKTILHPSITCSLKKSADNPGKYSAAQRILSRTRHTPCRVIIFNLCEHFVYGIYVTFKLLQFTSPLSRSRRMTQSSHGKRIVLLHDSVRS